MVVGFLVGSVLENMWKNMGGKMCKNMEGLEKYHTSGYGWIGQCTPLKLRTFCK